MNCTRMKVKTHWTNVGYNAARRGVTFDEIRLPGEKIANEWIRQGMEKWMRKATRLGMNRAAAHTEGGLLAWWKNTVEQHAAADEAKGRDWNGPQGCACAACRAARQAANSPERT